jgi:hypothetical protein
MPAACPRASYKPTPPDFDVRTFLETADNFQCVAAAHTMPAASSSKSGGRAHNFVETADDFQFLAAAQDCKTMGARRPPDQTS